MRSKGAGKNCGGEKRDERRSPKFISGLVRTGNSRDVGSRQRAVGRLQTRDGRHFAD